MREVKKNKIHGELFHLHFKESSIVSYQTDLYSQQNPYQNFSKLLCEYKKKLILMCILNDERPRISNTILKKNKFKKLTLPDFKQFYKAPVTRQLVSIKE